MAACRVQEKIAGSRGNSPPQPDFEEFTYKSIKIRGDKV
jgi:hypothetical protein